MPLNDPGAYDRDPQDQMDDRSSEEMRQEEKQERMSAFVAGLAAEATRRVGKRYSIEQRWIEDLQQYHGIYDRETLERLKLSKGSKVFINLTAAKTDAMEARLWDLQFPTDDRNWSIGPTPVPDLTDAAEAALSQVDEARDRANAAQAQGQEQMAAGDANAAQASEQEMRAAETEQNMAQAAADDLQEKIREASRRSDLMRDEIEDQFVGCDYQSQARDVIGDATKLGMGVIKGPVIGSSAGKQVWVKAAEGDGYELGNAKETAPSAYRVDPWSFFPDPDVPKVQDGSGCFERHLMSKTMLRKLAKRPDIDKDAVRELLRNDPSLGTIPAYITDLHDLTGQTDGTIPATYQVWEYTGPVETEDMQMLIEEMRDPEDTAPMEDLDPIEEHHVRVWFCDGKLLSFGRHPLDSKETIYSVFTIRADEATPFGFGIPSIMRHPQAIINGAYRMMMDNSGLSTGPQIVINKTAVEPEDGNWTLQPRKVWLRDDTTSQPGVKVFETFNIPSNQQEIANIIAMAEEAVDDVTAQPAIAQGEQGTGVTKTAQGMALLMNNANVTFRRIVKNFDDDITTPVVRRFYHWNMQFSEKKYIKGDYEVKARGSGVLLVREMQAQNLLMIAQIFGDHPVYGPRIKHGELLAAIFKAHMIATDEITMTEREYKQWEQDQKDSQDPAAAIENAKMELAKAEMDLRREEMDHKTALHEQEWAARKEIAGWTYDAAMEKAAAALNMKREELDARISGKADDNAHKERSMAAEIAMKERTGVSSGGAI